MWLFCVRETFCVFATLVAVVVAVVVADQVSDEVPSPDLDDVGRRAPGGYARDDPHAAEAVDKKPRLVPVAGAVADARRGVDIFFAEADGRDR